MAAMFTLTRQKCLNYAEGTASNGSKYIKFSTKEDAKNDVWDCTIWDEPSTLYIYNIAKKILRRGDYYNLTGIMQKQQRTIIDEHGEELVFSLLRLKVQSLELAQEMKDKKEENQPVQSQKLTGGFGM